MNVKTSILTALLTLTMSACSHIDESDRLIYVKPADVKRRVLLEDFTGQRCVNCPKASDEIKALQEQYGEDRIIQLMASHASQSMREMVEALKADADQFYRNLCNDIKNVGIPLAYDKIYGGMSNRTRPVSIFKWVYVNTPEKVKDPQGSNTDSPHLIGWYKVELGVYKRAR